jgi:hypothetical protein
VKVASEYIAGAVMGLGIVVVLYLTLIWSAKAEEAAGVLTRDAGLVVSYKDGAEF